MQRVHDPAARYLRRIGRQLERGENFREKKPGAELAVEQHRALAMPADPGFGGKVAFQHRSRYRRRISADRRPRSRKAVQFPQLFLHHFVIIIAPGIARDAPSRLSAFCDR